MSADAYSVFVASKFTRHVPTGIADPPELPAFLFAWQVLLVRCLLQRGRGALFADTGLGKTRMMLAWAEAVVRFTGLPVLILTPLAVAAQTVAEATTIGVDAVRVHEGREVAGPRIYVTNYDRLHLFDTSAFGGVVLDEGSILKDETASTRNELNEAFAVTPFRLSATATPAPNDWTELGNQAQFLGIRTREEMLAEFFVHDGGSTQDWRLKGHAVKAFWEWVSSWALVVRKPSDLGHDDGAFELPPLCIHERIVELGADYAARAGTLFVESAKTLSEQRAVRRNSIDERVRLAAELVATEPGEQWLVWGELNDECDALERAIQGAVQVAGKDDASTKETRLLGFANGDVSRLVSKPGICGAGLNFQRCARMIFVGATHSYERFYQAVRRCWRFGQTRPVDVYVIATDADRDIIENLKRKERDAQAMMNEASAHVLELTRAAVRESRNERADYLAKVPMRVPAWLITEAA